MDGEYDRRREKEALNTLTPRIRMKAFGSCKATRTVRTQILKGRMCDRETPEAPTLNQMEHHRHYPKVD